MMTLLQFANFHYELNEKSFCDLLTTMKTRFKEEFAYELEYISYAYHVYQLATRYGDE